MYEIVVAPWHKSVTVNVMVLDLIPTLEMKKNMFLFSWTSNEAKRGVKLRHSTFQKLAESGEQTCFNGDEVYWTET